jgi:regulator of replication initiation timing
MSQKKYLIIFLTSILLIYLTPEFGQAASTTIEGLKKQITLLQKQVTSLKNQNSKLATHNKALNYQNLKLVKDNQNIKTEIESVTKQNKDLIIAVENSSKIVDQLRMELVKFEPGSQWSGTYTANQIERSVKLFVSLETVELEFGPTSTNPDIPVGKFIMLPTYNEQTGSLILEAVKWTQKPNGYIMVDFDGSVSADYINGVVLNEKIVVGHFSVKRDK